MNKSNIVQKILLLTGIILLAGSLTFLIMYMISSNGEKVDTEKAVDFIKSVIPPKTVGIPEERSNSNMPVVSFDGQDYAALLNVPGCSAELPVRSQWDKRMVKNVPCRFYGNPYDGTLVIGGTDKKGQFDFITKIDIGDTVTVVDMKGYEFSYVVSAVRHADNADAETIIDEEYELTLFAKSNQTGGWVLVRCKTK